jgi:hypothetical protein
MPTITGQPALDVAIGLFFAFFLLSVLCSAVNETIATLLAWRSDTLLSALRSMLGAAPETTGTAAPPAAGGIATTTLQRPRGSAASGPKRGVFYRMGVGKEAKADAKALVENPRVAELLDHPLVRSLVDETSRSPMRRVVPSYLPSRTFALALLDTLTDAEADDNVLQQAKTSIDGIDEPHVKKALLTVLANAQGNVDRFRDGIEQWFDATMSRASGWYKRKTLASLWVIAAIVTLVFNADAAQIATALWKDPVLRASVVQQAQAAAKSQSDIKNPNPESAADKQTVTTQIERIRQLKLPLGWSTHRSDPRLPDDGWGWIVKILGLLATIVALTLGAPFWFDALGKVSRLRGSGEQPAAPPAPAAAIAITPPAPGPA